MVLPYINMILPQVYTCSPSRNPLIPPSPYHPSGSSQWTSPKQSVSVIELGQAICFIYDIIHVSMPFFQIIPPSPSPTESKRLFCTSVSLLLTHIQGYHYHLSKFNIYALLLLLSHFSRVQICTTPKTAAHQAPPSLGFSRQEHWSGLPFSSPMHEKWKVKVKSLSRVRLFATPWTAAYQAPPSMGFSRQEYWSGVPYMH